MNSLIRFVFLFPVFLVISSYSKAQTIDCKKFKNGTFKMTYEGKKGIIKRYQGIQEEYLNGDGKPTMVFQVKWINDCMYTLTQDAHPPVPVRLV